jgi:hypothetical protein
MDGASRSIEGAFSLVRNDVTLPAAVPMLALASSQLPLKSTLGKLLMTLL